MSTPSEAHERANLRVMDRALGTGSQAELYRQGGRALADVLRRATPDLDDVVRLEDRYGRTGK